MSSRRGGSRGCAASQRQLNSPSSSMEITSEVNRTPGRVAERGILRERGEIMDYGHSEHPAIRYRIPCTLKSNTLIVSVTVEHCSNLRGRVIDLNAPMVDMEVPRVDMRRPIRQEAQPAMQAEEAGPSETKPNIQLSVADMADQKLKGKQEDEPYTTDED